MAEFDPKTSVEPLSPPEAEFLEDRPWNPELGEPRSFAPTGRVRQGPPGEVLARWPAAWDEIPAERFIRMPAGDVDALAAPSTAVAAEAARDRALIVIPCLNEAAAIERVIGEILADDGLVDPLVLVADGGSSDGTRAIVGEIAARDGRVRLIDNPGRLQSAGVNLAARLMGEGRPWLVRVDAHADYPARYVSTLIAEARASGAASVVVAMDTRGEGAFQRAAAAAQNSRLGTGGAAHRVGGVGWVDHGHHALFRLDAFSAAGGYDEAFSHNEDAEFDLRLRGGGGTIWLTDKVRIGYHPRATARALARQYFSYGKGRARTVLKHRARLKARQALPLAVAPALLLALFAPLSGVFALPALAWAAAALAYGAGLAIRARDPVVALSGPAAMVMHAAWSAGFWRQLAAHALARRVAVPEPRFVPAAAE